MKSKTIDLLFLAAFLFIGVTLFTTYSSFRKLDVFNQLVDHSYVVKNKITDLESEFRSMLSNQRTYLLTGEPQYLIKYRERKDQVELLFNELEAKIQDNPIQIKNLDTLRSNYERHAEALLKELNLFSVSPEKNNSGITNTIALTTRHSEQFLRDIEVLDKVEDDLLSERLDNQGQGERMTPIAFSVLGALSFGIIAFAFFRQKVDLNEKEKLLSNKRQLLKRLLYSNAELEEYAYLASHDLQEPLRKIQMFTDTAKLSLERNEPEETRRFLNKIDRSSQEARKMIKGLLEHAHLVKTKDELSLVRVSDLFQEVASEFRIAHKPDITFEISVEKTPMIMAFESQILELLRNLFSNALKFRKEHTNLVVIGLLYRETGLHNDDFHQITVFDKGCGFEDSYSQHIFEMFSKLNLHINSRKNNLGLSLCKKIMENHRGTISAESTPGEGTRIHLFFPKEA